MPDVSRLEHEAGAESAADRGDLGVGEIFGQDEREDAAVAVMLDQSLVGHVEALVEQFFRGEDLAAGEIDHPAVVEIQRGGEAEAEVVSHAGLGQRLAMAVGDLSARRGDVDQVGARLFLGLPSRLGHVDHVGESLVGGHRGRRQKGGQDWQKAVHRAPETFQ